ncbi:hypothetical protein [Nonomuraea endophytica]|uniref:hypothetical protein n=1 Tax=Nonomuraea endophytica TaxID=714136 RepID=UPI0037CB6FD7
MRHTESDLRTLLATRSDGFEPSVTVDAVVRRGRRVRMRRRVLAAALAGTALVAAMAVTTDAFAPEPPPAAVRVEPDLEVPEEFVVKLGALDTTLPLLHSERFTTMGPERTVTFQPVGWMTGFRVVCEDPKAWVVVVGEGRGKEPTGSVGRCRSGVGGHHDKLSAPSDWLRKPQSLRIWVFPGDARIPTEEKDRVGCERKSAQECADSMVSRALLRPAVRKAMSGEIGSVPGRWAAAVYDRP